MLARRSVEIDRPPEDLDALVDWFDRVSGNLVLLEEYPPAQLRRAVEVVARAVDEHARSADLRPGAVDPRGPVPGPAAVLRADHERFRTSAEQLRALSRLVEIDGHGGNRQALGQYGRVLTEALRRHRREELELDGTTGPARPRRGR